MAAPLLLGTPVMAEPLPQSSKAQLTPTQQRLQQLEQAERDAKAAEERKWRTFPKPRVYSTSAEEIQGEYANAIQAILNPSGAPESCSYNWAEWKLDSATGIRSTQMRCRRSYHRAVAVNCSTLQLSTADFDFLQPPDTWGRWRLPGDEGERQMVVALCGNLHLAQ